MPEHTINYDFELQERYAAFTAEIARLGLLGLSAIAYVVWQSPPGKVAALGVSSIVALLSAAIFLSGAIAFALLHRYYSVDIMSCHLRVTRLQAQAVNSNSREGDDVAQDERLANEKERRARALETSARNVGTSSVMLALGAFSLGAFAISSGIFALSH